MTLPGVLLVVGLVVIGVAPIVFGVRGLKRSRDWMQRVLAILGIAVGGVYFVTFAVVAFLLHTAPWIPMLIVLASGAVTALLIFWGSVLADCLLNEPNDGTGKVVWVLAIALTFVIGAAIYYFGRRPRRLAETTK